MFVFYMTVKHCIKNHIARSSQQMSLAVLYEQSGLMYNVKFEYGVYFTCIKSHHIKIKS